MLQPISGAFICWCVISHHPSKHRLIESVRVCVYVYGCVLTLRLACHQVFLNNPCKNAIKAVCCATSSSSSPSRNTSENMIIKPEAYQGQDLYSKIKQNEIFRCSIYIYTGMATSKPVQLHVTCTISNPSNHLAATQYVYASECGREMISVTSSVLLVPDRLVWIFQKLPICWYFHTQPPLGLKENGPTLYIYCIKIYGLSAKFLLCKQRMMSPY